MRQQTKRLLNILLFQLGWWGCFIAASQKLSLWSLGTGIVFVLFCHFFLVVDKKVRFKELYFILVTASLGYIADSLWFNLNIVRFSWDFFSMAPLWMFAMWLVFPMAIGHSFSWLERRYIITFLVGGIGAPLSYRFGSSFDLIYFDSPKVLIIYGVYWGIFMNFIVWLKQQRFFKELECA
jgi:hypothetical protein